VQRRVGGYNINMIEPRGPGSAHNMAHLLVGSEGTLAFFTEIELDLQPIPAHRRPSTSSSWTPPGSSWSTAR
jgi:hypothetical protein